jgi:hypothetical protein
LNVVQNRGIRNPRMVWKSRWRMQKSDAGSLSNTR